MMIAAIRREFQPGLLRRRGKIETTNLPSDLSNLAKNCLRFRTDQFGGGGGGPRSLTQQQQNSYQ